MLGLISVINVSLVVKIRQKDDVGEGKLILGGDARQCTVEINKWQHRGFYCYFSAILWWPMVILLAIW